MYILKEKVLFLYHEFDPNQMDLFKVVYDLQLVEEEEEEEVPPPNESAHLLMGELRLNMKVTRRGKENSLGLLCSPIEHSRRKVSFEGRPMSLRLHYFCPLWLLFVTVPLGDFFCNHALKGLFL